jgi:hypothetical protein
MSPFFDPFSSGGRYRFRLGRSLDPHEELHPEMAEEPVDVSSEVPGTIDELIAMQQKDKPEPSRPEKPEKPDKVTEKVRKALDYLGELGNSPSEDQQVELHLLRQLESFHDQVVADLQSDATAKHTQISSWSVDADRLMHCRIILESIEFE